MLVGIGKGKRENELHIAIRGTKTGHDWMTNLNLGLHKVLLIVL